MKSRSEDPATSKAPSPARPRRQHASRPPSAKVVYMTSTEAQNGFGRVLEIVGRNGTVFITRRNASQAVILSVDRYEELTGQSSSNLDTLAAEFDQLLERMQAPGALEGMLAALRVSPEEFGRAAVAAAKRDAP